MKLWKSTLPLIIVTIVGLLYLLQSCGGVHYDSYVETYKEIAMKEMQRTGYPASIKLAQAILESQGGRGKLAFDYNNHFGISCGSNWPGKKYYQEEEDFYNGDKVEICYRVYNKPESSFVAHTDLIKKDYRKLFHKIDPMDYVAWAKRLSELQYSDSDTYDATLINMIERYKLYEFDEMAMGVDSRPMAQEVSDFGEKADYSYDKERPKEYGYEKDRPKEYGYEKESLEEYEYRRKKRIEEYRDGLKDLEEDITKHQKKYPPIPSDYPREREYYSEPESYEEEDSYYTENSNYRKDRRVEESEWDRKPQRTDYDQVDTDYYERPSSPSRRSSTRFDNSNIDEKYGIPERQTSYRTPSKPYNNNRKTYPSSYSNDYVEFEKEEGTRLSDFRVAEDYAYINGVKVTTARYDDTPLMIAKRFNVSVKDLIHFNEQIKSTKQLLREDQRIYLAAKKKNYEGNQRYHIVQFGERMEDIADRFGLSVKALYDKNKMPFGSEPALGEKIKLDRGRIKKRPELRYKAAKPLSQSSRNNTERVPPATPITDNFPNRVNSSQEATMTTVLLQPVTTGKVFHFVKEGETLYRIAANYGTTVDAIKNMNHLSQNTIKRGMRLKIR